MKYLAGSAQMKEIDRYTIEEIGIPSLVLMERATTWSKKVSVGVHV